LYKFTNGFGASVIRHGNSYGHEDGKWELAVTETTKNDKFRITYDTPITDDVIGYLDDGDVEMLLDQIEALP